MPTQFFTGGNDSYTINSPGDYYLAFLGGNDTLIVNGGTNIYATMGEDDDLVWVQAAGGFYNIYAESGADRFELWNGNGFADGGGGNDTFNIRGGSGFVIAGRAGNDRFNFHVATSVSEVNGGDGNDTFFGFRNMVTGNVLGATGNDFFVDFIGASLYGGLGNDIYRIHPTGTPTIIESVGEGTDAVQVSRGYSYTLPDNVENLAVGSYSGSTAGTATLYGNAGDNSIIGWSNDETINGWDGNDKLVGKGGNDILSGSNGNDLLDGGTGNDALNGGDGNDTLNGRAGDDTMNGGNGDDIYYVDSLGDTVTEGVGAGVDEIRTTVGGTLPGEVENARVWTSTGLFIVGNELDNLLIGNSGADSFLGLDGNDTIYGNAGNDGIDGGNGDDILRGNAGDDQLLGGVGLDELDGGSGNDLLYGEDESDVLSGGAGIDFLDGGLGSDTLTGGADGDTFDFDSVAESVPGAWDYITDFFPSGSGTGDIIDLSGIDADTSTAGDQAFTFNFGTPTAHGLWYTATTNGDGSFNIVWYADVNGDTTPEFELHVHQTGIVLIGSDLIL